MLNVKNIDFKRLENELIEKKDDLIGKFKVLSGEGLISDDIISISNEYISIMRKYGTLDYSISVHTNEKMMPISYGNFLSLPAVELNRISWVDYEKSHKKFIVNLATFDIDLKIKDLMKINTGLNLKQIIENTYILPKISGIYLSELNLSDEELLNVEVSISIKIEDRKKEIKDIFIN